MVNNGKAKGLSRSHSTQSDEEPHTNAFVAGLETIPTDDWIRTWTTDRTIILRRTSKRVKEQVDKMRLSVVVRLCTTGFTKDCRNFMTQCHDDTEPEKIQIVMRELPLMTSW
jgi:hypothetical protein